MTYNCRKIMKIPRRAAMLLRRIALRLVFPGRIKPSELKTYLWNLLPIKVKARHQELTLLCSVDQQTGVPTRLLEATTHAVEHAARQSSILLDDRMSSKRNNPDVSALLRAGYSANIWPGEHYRLLTGLVCVLQARNVIEIGTFWGGGALALKHGLEGNDGCVTTFDIVGWDSYEATLLTPGDFDGKLVQFVTDLQDPSAFATHQALFENADLIFLDAAKDGVMERNFLSAFARCRFKKSPILVVDDIHLWNMLDIWEEIKWPKLDITCFGHYTGTGIVELPKH